VKKIRQSKAIVYNIFSCSHIDIVICGLIPDGRNLESRAKLEVAEYLQNLVLKFQVKL